LVKAQHFFDEMMRGEYSIDYIFIVGVQFLAELVVPEELVKIHTEPFKIYFNTQPHPRPPRRSDTHPNLDENRNTKLKQLNKAPANESLAFPTSKYHREYVRMPT
jgi:hypothetical protein